MKILMIDDLSEITSPFEFVFKSKGHEFTATHTVNDGLKMIKENKYDFIILDIDFGEDKPDAAWLLDKLSEINILEKQKIAILTNSTNQKEINICLTKGAIKAWLKEENIFMIYKEIEKMVNN